MKKIIRKAAFVAAFALAAGYGVYSSQEAVELSDLALANIEAIAQGEYDPSPNPGSRCTGGPRMCYMGQGNVWGMN